MENQIFDNILTYFNPITNETDRQIIADAFKNHVFKQNVSALVLYYYGIYWQKKNPEKAITYFIESFYKGDEKAIHHIYKYYENNPEKLHLYLDSLHNYTDINFLRLCTILKNNRELFAIKCKEFVDNNKQIIQIVYIVKFYIETDELKACLAVDILRILKSQHYFIFAGMLFERKNQYDAALKYYRQAAELKDASANYHAGLMLFKQDKLDEALQYFMKDDKNPSYCLYIGIIHHKNKNIEEAKEWYIKAANLGNISAMLNIADLCKTDDPDNAIVYYIMAADKRNEKAIKTLARLGNVTNSKYKSQLGKKYALLAAEIGDTEMYFTAGQYLIHDNDNVLTHKYFDWIIKNKKETAQKIAVMDYYYLRIEKNLERSAEYYKATIKYNSTQRRQSFDNLLKQYIYQIYQLTSKCSYMEF
jgi:TPR repeat protein